MTQAGTTAAIRAAWQNAGLDDGALKTFRATALDTFGRLGLPTRHQEAWRYTDVSDVAAALPGWLATTVGSGAGTVAAATATAPELDVADGIHITLVDGVAPDRITLPTGLPDGVFVASLAETAAKQPDKLAALGSLASPNDSGFIALNSAFATHGIVITLADDTQLDRPLVIHYLTTRPEVVAQPRLLVQLGHNATASIVEHYRSHHAAVVNPVAEFICGRGADLHYCKVQDESTATWHIAAQCVALAADAQLHSAHVDIGGQLARNDFSVNLDGPGAAAETRGLFMADGQRHTESRITVNHRAPHTTSRERYRGILAGRARGVFNGRIAVDSVAQKTSADLTNRNLLLDRGAEIDTKPELEIYADDVKCAHGSTTGQLDAQALFYLLSRGVDPQTARSMLITAFASELLTDLRLPAVAERARAALNVLKGEGS